MFDCKTFFEYGAERLFFGRDVTRNELYVENKNVMEIEPMEKFANALSGLSVCFWRTKIMWLVMSVNIDC